MNRRELARIRREERRAFAERGREERRALAQRQRERRVGRSNILDAPIPEINVPILKPDAPVRSKSKSLNKVSKPLRKEINKFADWIKSYVPPPIKKPVNERVERLKKRVNEIFERYERYKPRERKTALEGTLKTYRVEGQKSPDPKIYMRNVRDGVINLSIIKANQ